MFYFFVSPPPARSQPHEYDQKNLAPNPSGNPAQIQKRPVLSIDPYIFQ